MLSRTDNLGPRTLFKRPSVIGFWRPPLVSLSKWRLPYRLRELCVFVSVATLPLGAVFALDSAETVKSVLVLCGESGDLPAMQAMEENLREAFHSSRFPRIDLFSEYLDFARFSGDQQLGLKALRWQWVPYGASENDSSNPLLINWQALKKAALPEERVPATEKQQRRDARDRDHVQILGDEEQPEP